MELSIVATLYQSAPYLEEFYLRISAEAQKITRDYEIVFVNDGSHDDSLALALALMKKDAKVRVIDLWANFGHHKAILMGLTHVRGRLIFLIDCDLEEEPELLDRFYKEMKDSGADVIYGIQQKRKGGFFERISGHIYYFVFNLLSSYPIPPNLLTAKLMEQKYVARLVEYQDPDFFLAGFWAMTGFKQVAVIVKKHDKGQTTYTLGRKISFFVNVITSFSDKPLIFIFYLGLIIMASSGAAALVLVTRKILFGSLLAGWPSLIVSVWLLGGVTIFLLGIIGIYLSKIFMRVKQRPYAVVREIHERLEENT